MINIWNEKIKPKERWIMLVIGMVLTIGLSFVYRKFYYSLGNSYNYVYLADFVVFIALGIESIILTFNLHNKIISSVLFVLLGILLDQILTNNLFRVGSIILIITVIVFMITIIIKNIFSTVITFSMLSLPFMLIITIILNRLKINDYIVIYTGLVLFLLFYKLVGVKVNQVFIGKFMGFASDANKYDELQLKSQLNLIYVIVFVVLNINNVFIGDKAIVGNLLNNSFLTCLAVIQIDWKKVFGVIDKQLLDENIRHLLQLGGTEEKGIH